MEPMHGDRVAGTKLNLDLGLCCPPMLTWPPLCGPSHFKQLDMEGHMFYSRVCVINCVWKFSTKFPTKMVNLNNLLFTVALN